MRKRSVVAALALAIVPALAQQDAGITASLSASGLNYLISTLIPVIEAKIGSITIPGISGEKDGFDYSMNDIKCQGFTIGSATATLAAPASLSITLDGLGISCTADWSFKLKSWPHVPDGGGSADVSMSSTSASVGLALTVDALRPQLTGATAALHIGSLDVSFHGSAWDWLLDIFKGYLESAIKNALDSQFGTAIADFIDTDGNAFLASIPIAVPLRVRAPYNISSVRFGVVPGGVAATPAYLGLAVQGDIVPTGFNGQPPITPPALPPFDASYGSFYIQGRFSPYTLLSAAWTYVQAGLFNFAVASHDIPLGLNSTAAYGLIAPGMGTQYPGGSVSLALDLSTLPTLTIAPAASGGITAGADLAVSFLVTPATGGAAVTAFTLDVSAAFSMAIGVSADPANPASIVFNGTLAYLHASLALANSTVGPVNAPLLQGLVDLTLPFLLAGVNEELAKGIPLPSVPGLAFKASTTALQLAQGYVLFGADFTFTPPTSAVAAPAAEPKVAAQEQGSGKKAKRVRGAA